MIAELKRVVALSGREVDLLKLAGEGCTDRAIAGRLGISQATVGTYWGRIRMKMGPFSRTELVGMKVRAEVEATLQALRAENERLAQQVRIKAIEVEDPNLYLQLLHNASDAVVVANREGNIEFVNDAACTLFGYGVDQLLAENIDILVPKRLCSKLTERLEECMSTQNKCKIGKYVDILACRRDGSEFPIAIAFSVTNVRGFEHVLCIIRDVSEEEILRRLDTSEAPLTTVGTDE